MFVCNPCAGMRIGQTPTLVTGWPPGTVKSSSSKIRWGRNKKDSTLTDCLHTHGHTRVRMHMCPHPRGHAHTENCNTRIHQNLPDCTQAPAPTAPQPDVGTADVLTLFLLAYTGRTRHAESPQKDLPPYTPPTENWPWESLRIIHKGER